MRAKTITCMLSIGHVNNIPTKQFFTGIFRNTQSKLYTQSLTEWDWDFQNNALWDTHTGMLCFIEFLQSLFIKLYLVSYICWCSRQQCQCISSYLLSEWHPPSDVVGELEVVHGSIHIFFFYKVCWNKPKKTSAENFKFCMIVVIFRHHPFTKALEFPCYIYHPHFINSSVLSSNALVDT